MQSVIDKFHPRNFKCSPLMHAILWFICCSDDNPWAVHPDTGPIRSLSVTSDGFVTDMNVFIGSLDDLERNLKGCADVVELTKEERMWFQQRINTMVSQQFSQRKIFI